MVRKSQSTCLKDLVRVPKGPVTLTFRDLIITEVTEKTRYRINHIKSKKKRKQTSRTDIDDLLDTQIDHADETKGETETQVSNNPN